MRPAVVALLLLLLAGVGCEVVPSEQFEPVLNVHCLLVAGGNPWPLVFVNRTYAIDEEYQPWLDSVGITLARGPETWSSFLPHPTLVSAYEGTARVPVRPGDTFSVRVTCPGYDTVYGTTVVPDSFRILRPANGDTVVINDSLIWLRSRRAKGYYSALARAAGEDTFYITFLVPNDSLPGFPYDSLQGVLPLYFLNGNPEGELTLPFLALDTNYFDFVAAGGFGFGPGGPVADTTRLVGGVGVLGSATACSLRINLRYPETRAGGQSPGPVRESPVARANRSSAKSYPLPGRLAYPATSSSSSWPGLGSNAITIGRHSPGPPAE